MLSCEKTQTFHTSIGHFLDCFCWSWQKRPWIWSSRHPCVAEKTWICTFSWKAAILWATSVNHMITKGLTGLALCSIRVCFLLILFLSFLSFKFLIYPHGVLMKATVTMRSINTAQSEASLSKHTHSVLSWGYIHGTVHFKHYDVSASDQIFNTWWLSHYIKCLKVGSRFLQREVKNIGTI